MEEESEADLRMNESAGGVTGIRQVAKSVSFDIKAVLVYGCRHINELQFRGMKNVTKESQSMKHILVALLIVILLCPRSAIGSQ